MSYKFSLHKISYPTLKEACQRDPQGGAPGAQGEPWGGLAHFGLGVDEGVDSLRSQRNFFRIEGRGCAEMPGALIARTSGVIDKTGYHGKWF